MRQDMAEPKVCVRYSLRRVTRTAGIGSKNNAAAQHNFIPWNGCRTCHTLRVPREGKEIAMLRELHLLTAGFVFLFLGAIVVGIF